MPSPYARLGTPHAEKKSHSRLQKEHLGYFDNSSCEKRWTERHLERAPAPTYPRRNDALEKAVLVKEEEFVILLLRPLLDFFIMCFPLRVPVTKKEIHIPYYRLLCG